MLRLIQILLSLFPLHLTHEHLRSIASPPLISQRAIEAACVFLAKLWKADSYIVSSVLQFRPIFNLNGLTRDKPHTPADEASPKPTPRACSDRQGPLHTMAVSTSSPRLHFEPDSVPLPTSSDNAEPASPALSSSTALARFEFESGRGNEGTKILMVEWEDESAEGSIKNMGDWEVSWEGKSTVLSARDGAEGKLHRLYFLLAPGASIPRIIKLSQVGGKTIQTNPLPAIFPPELGLTARQAGRKGVLHTIWAKKRISVLQREIDEEMKTNGEGIGLEMAMQEKQWIEENFGVGPRVTQPDLQQNATPTSPKTPGGGRLSEKLKGLKLGTSAHDLSNISGTCKVKNRRMKMVTLTSPRTQIRKSAKSIVP